jgi:hypothetical protein
VKELTNAKLFSSVTLLSIETAFTNYLAVKERKGNQKGEGI